MTLWLRTYWPVIAVLAASAAAGLTVGRRHGAPWGLVAAALVLAVATGSLLAAEASGRREERKRAEAERRAFRAERAYESGRHDAAASPILVLEPGKPDVVVWPKRTEAQR